MVAELPSRARVVMGGGVIGCSISYHLAKLGPGDFDPGNAGMRA